MSCITKTLCGLSCLSNVSHRPLTHIDKAAIVIMVALVILAACAYAKVGAFAQFTHAYTVGFSSVAVVACLLFALIVRHSKCSEMESQIGSREPQPPEEEGLHVVCKPMDMTDDQISIAPKTPSKPNTGGRSLYTEE